MLILNVKDNLRFSVCDALLRHALTLREQSKQYESDPAFAQVIVKLQKEAASLEALADFIRP